MSVEETQHGSAEVAARVERRWATISVIIIVGMALLAEPFSSRLLVSSLVTLGGYCPRAEPTDHGEVSDFRQVSLVAWAGKLMVCPGPHPTS